MKKKKEVSSRALIDSLKGTEIAVTGQTLEDADSNLSALILDMARKTLADPVAKEDLLNRPDPRQRFLDLRLKHDSEVSDEAFFTLILENHHYLYSRFAMQKIGRWQTEMKANDRPLAERAEEKLKRIGTTLALKGQEKPRVPSTYVATIRKDVLQALKGEKILDIPYVRRAPALQELFGVDISNDDLRATYEELAHMITGKLLGRSADTIDKDMKKIEEIETGKPFSAFRRKTPK